MTKSKRFNLRLTPDIYDFILEVSDMLECSKSEAVNKILTLAQVVYHTELKDLLLMLAMGYDVEFAFDDEEEKSEPPQGL